MSPGVAARRLALALALATSVMVSTTPPAPVGAEASDAAPVTPRRTAAAIAAGGNHTCVVDESSDVRCWGAGDAGQLGTGAIDDVGDAVGDMGFGLGSVPLGPGRTAVAVAAGDAHTCALLDNGSVTCWGEGAAGRLGTGATADVGDGPGELGGALASVPLGSGRTAIAITAGSAHTCALLDDGSIKCWGDGAAGRLGTGATADIGDGPGELGANLPPVRLGAGRTATAVAAGDAHTCAILDDGSVKCWGEGSDGRLGSGATADVGDAAGEMGDALDTVDLGTDRTARALSAGRSHTCAVLDDATLKCWGDSANGRLGNDSTTDDVGDAAGEMGDALDTVDLGTDRTARAVSAGRAHTCAVLDDATVKCWGSGADGRLGNGSTTSIGDGVGLSVGDAAAVDLGTGRTALGVTAGGTHTCVVLDDGLLTCFGSGADGRLGNEAVTNVGDGVGPTVAASTPLELGPRAEVAQLTGGAFHTCALLTDATVKCWGGNATGQLGLGTTDSLGDQPGEMGNALPPVDLGTGRTPVEIDAGYEQTCVRFDDGAVKCWGGDSFATGALGSGSTTPIGDGPGEMGDDLDPIDLGTGRTAVDIAVAPSHACALLDDATVKCWGSAASGAIGSGDNTDNLGDAPNEMGDALPVVALPAGRSAVAIDADGNHTCALLDNGELICWGDNSSGQLGRNDTTTVGDGIGPAVSSLTGIDFGGGRLAASFEAGQEHTCAILDDDATVCWGRGMDGELGQESPLNIGDGAGDDVDVTPAIDLGTNRTASSIAVGFWWTCAVLDDDTATCWGRGSEGRLGTESNSDVGDAAMTMGDDLVPVDVGTGRSVTRFALGNAHSCAILDDGTAKCWGYNGNGQLGNGTSSFAEFVGDAPGEMGDELPPIPIASSKRVLLAPLGTPTPSSIISLDPERFVDTRPTGETLDDVHEAEGKRAPRSEYRVRIGGRGMVPADAAAVVVNITAIQAEATGYVTAHPCVDPRPLASSLNYTAGVNLGNEVIAPLSGDGELCLYTFAAAHLTLDVTGYVPSSSPIEPLTPGRFLDTRPAPVGETIDGTAQGGTKPAAGSTTRLGIAGRGGVPSNAAAVIVNVTAIGAASNGYVTVHPCLDTAPLAASLNYVAGVNRGNELIATLDDDGDICLFTSGSVHLAADVVGYLPAGTNVGPIGPARLMDTRAGADTVDGVAAGGGARTPGSEFTLQVTGRAGVPLGATAAVLNVTAVFPASVGFVTVHPCQSPRPNTASLNHVAGVNGGNEIVARLNSAGQVCLFTSQTTHLTVDVVAATT